MSKNEKGSMVLYHDNNVISIYCPVSVSPLTFTTSRATLYFGLACLKVPRKAKNHKYVCPIQHFCIWWRKKPLKAPVELLIWCLYGTLKL